MIRPQSLWINHRKLRLLPFLSLFLQRIYTNLNSVAVAFSGESMGHRDPCINPLYKRGKPEEHMLVAPLLFLFFAWLFLLFWGRGLLNRKQILVQSTHQKPYDLPTPTPRSATGLNCRSWSASCISQMDERTIKPLWLISISRRWHILLQNNQQQKTALFSLKLRLYYKQRAIFSLYLRVACEHWI